MIILWSKCRLRGQKKFSLSFFSSSGTHQSNHLDGYQVIGINSSFIEAFWAFGFLYPSYHSMRPLLYESYCKIFSCCCVTNPSGASRKKTLFLHCIITNLLCFKMFRDIFQRPWHFFNNIITNFLRLKVIRNILQLPWPFFNNIITHFLRLKVIRDNFQHPWIFFGCLDLHPLSFKKARNKIKRHRTVVGLFYPANNRHILF